MAINPKSKLIFRSAYLAIAVLCFVFLVLNFNFFIEQVRFLFAKPTTVQTSSNSPLSTPNFLEVPSLNISTPLIYVSETSEEAFQKALEDGVVHYPETANPGENGNAYFFGHSSDYIWSKGNYKSVFALLPKIQIGDKIRITNQKGEQFSYTVTKTFVVTPEDLSVLDQYGNQKKILSLQTSYPVGTALKRYIVQAEISTD